MLLCEGTVRKSSSPTNYEVYIPLFDSTYDCPLCYNPGVKPQLPNGTIVYVSFVNNNYGMPVIVGAKYDAEKSLLGLGNLKTLCVNQKDSSADLPASTTIGDITADEIKCLSGCTRNISKTLSDLESSLSKINLKDLEDVTSITLNSSMYGTAEQMNKITDAVDGQLYFVIQEDS